MSKTPDLLNEKCLWDIYMSSRKLPHSKFNTRVTALVAIVLVGYFYLFCIDIEKLEAKLLFFADNGFLFTSTILGFLIAGFTVFSTITKPELFVHMAKEKSKFADLSFLKYNFFRFVDVFIHYLLLAGLCFGIQLLFKEPSMVSQVLYQLAEPAFIKGCIVEISFVLLISIFVYCLLLLKSFIFNIYHVVATSIQWEVLKPPKDE